jgi:integrase
VKGIKSSTLGDYAAALRYPDHKPKHRGHTPVARVMRTFGGRRLTAITTAVVSRWLVALDRDPALSVRSVNKHRHIVGAIFMYACRQDTFALAVNPASATEKRREADFAEIVTYSPAEVFAISRALGAGHHRDHRGPAPYDEKIAARRAEDEQDAAPVIVAGFAGLRMGELLALRWRHINFQAQRLHVQRSYSAGEESSPKGRKGRTVPLADQPAQALARLGQRPAFTAPADLVFCSRIGKHLDGSALSRRYKRASDIVCADAPDMPALRFHDLRHTFGTLAAGSFDLVNVQAMLGHADARTTSRYLHARPAAEDAAKLSAIFGSEAPDASPTVRA